MGVLKQLQGRQWETTHRWSSPTRTRLGSARTSTSSTRSAPAPSPLPTWAPCSAPSARTPPRLSSRPSWRRWTRTSLAPSSLMSSSTSCLAPTRPRSRWRRRSNAFLTFDADGSGFITREELIETLTTMGDPVDEETITGMIQEADVDGDGKINYEEFTKIMLAP